LKLLDEEFGAIPVELLLWRDPNAEPKQFFSGGGGLRSPGVSVSDVKVILAAPEGLEVGLKGNRHG
jgi:hypothetical protein